MLNTILTTKQYMTQFFDKESKAAIPVTILEAKSCVVCGLKDKEKDGYTAVVLGYGKRRNASKPEIGKYKEIGYVPMFVREQRVDSLEGIAVGQKLDAETFSAGDKVKIQGVSKGKGFQGVVKRWGFAGGPKTHGQSDRWRAPGSIGMGTDPGRVFKGKKMPGRMGGDNKSILTEIIGTDKENGFILIKGSVPGGKNALIFIESSNRK